MENKLKEILAILETDLKDIDSAVKHISKSKEAAQSVVDSNSKFSNSFRKSFDELQDQLQTVKSDFQDSTNNVKKQWEQLTAELKELSSKLRDYIGYLDSVNVPKRLEKIENAVDSVGLDLHNVKEQIVASENSLKSEFDLLAKELDQKLEIEKKFLNHELNRIERIIIDKFSFTSNFLDGLAKKQKFNRIMLIMIGLLIVLSLMISLIK